MAIVPGAWLLVALNGAMLLVALAVAAYVLRRRPAAASTGEDWRAGALDLAREVQRATVAAERPVDYDRVSRQLLPLAGRIQRHVRAAPPGVEEPVYRGLFELGVACQRVAVEHRSPPRVGGPFLEDRLESLRADAAALATTVDAGYSNPCSNTANAT